MLPDPEGQEPELDPTGSPDPETATPAAETPPVTTEPGAELTEGSPAPSESAAPDPTAPAALAAPAPVADPNTFIPPEGGTPFTFAVDGRQVALEGAKVLGDHILIPKDVWLNQVRPNFLADRTAVRERERGLRRELAARETGQSEESKRSKALIAVVDQLFANPDALLKAAENWHIEGPKLRTEAELNVTRQDLERYRQQEAEAKAREEEAELMPKLQNGLALAVEDLLAEAGVQWDGNQAEEARWKGFVEALEQDIGLTSLFSRDHRGQIVLDEDRVRRAFNRERARGQSQQAVAKVVEKKTALNAAATAPTKPSAPVAGKPPAKPVKAERTRDDNGQFTKRLDPDEWERDFMKRQFTKEL